MKSIILKKVESVSIELGLIDDLKKTHSKIQSLLSEEIKLRTEALKLASKAKDLDKRYKSLEKTAKSDAAKASSQIKDLGMQEPAILESIYDSFGVDVYKNIIREFR